MFSGVVVGAVRALVGDALELGKSGGSRSVPVAEVRGSSSECRAALNGLLT